MTGTLTLHMKGIAMISRIRKSIENKDQGFTLIELLVVIIIIGILAAIAIPLFLNQRRKAEDSAAKADVSTIGKEVATYFVDWDGTTVPVISVTAGGVYQLTAGTEVTDLGNQSTNVVLGTMDIVDADEWCVAVHNEEGDKSTTAKGGYSYSASEGLVNAVCP